MKLQFDWFVKENHGCSFPLYWISATSIVGVKDIALRGSYDLHCLNLKTVVEWLGDCSGSRYTKHSFCPGLITPEANLRDKPIHLLHTHVELCRFSVSIQYLKKLFERCLK